MIRLLPLLLLLTPLLASCSSNQAKEKLSQCAARLELEAKVNGSKYFTHATQGDDAFSAVLHFNKNGKKWTTQGFCENEDKNSCMALSKKQRMKEEICQQYNAEIDKEEMVETAKRHLDKTPLARCINAGKGKNVSSVGSDLWRQWLDEWNDQDCRNLLGFSSYSREFRLLVEKTDEIRANIGSKWE